MAIRSDLDVGEYRYLLGVYQKHGIQPVATLDEMKPTVLSLVSNPLTITDAVQLVLGRRVDAKEMQAKQEYLLLLISVTTEEKWEMLMKIYHQENLNT